MAQRGGRARTRRRGHVVLKSIEPDASRSPYYIYTPAYTRFSAGIRCLHLLCHWLNRSGEPAYLVIMGKHRGPATRPDLLAPLLTPGVVAAHFSQGRCPVVVYPEILAGNPAGAGRVVRYVMNFPGLLGGEARFEASEMIYAYSGELARACGVPGNVLHMPVLDRTVFTHTPARARKGACFYAAKYQEELGQTVSGLPEGAVEITRNRSDSQTPAEIAELFRSSEYFYAFENTALSTEAVLCGCPAVLMPGPLFTSSIAVEELGWDGYAWGESPLELERAKSTVDQGRLNYQKTIDAFPASLARFIAKTQDFARGHGYRKPVDCPDLQVGDIKALIRSKVHWTLPERARLALFVLRSGV